MREVAIETLLKTALGGKFITYKPVYDRGY